MNYRSVSDLNQAILANLSRLPQGIDLVVGIPRSGLLAANLFALHLNLPLADLDGFVEGRVLNAGANRRRPGHAFAVADCRKALIVDDSLWAGKEIARARERVAAANLGVDVVFAVVYCNPELTELVDYYCEVCPLPRVFEWNIMNHAVLDRACVDIDGILCPDPTEKQNDDGVEYEEFIANTPPLFTPSRQIGWLVTARLEKYRTATEAWLRKHQISYRELRMLNLPTMAARRAANAHASFKADVYASVPADLFIESSRRQAESIANKTMKPVFCAETRRLLIGNIRGTPNLVGTRLRRLYSRVRRVVASGFRIRGNNNIGHP